MKLIRGGFNLKINKATKIYVKIFYYVFYTNVLIA